MAQPGSGCCVGDADCMLPCGCCRWRPGSPTPGSAPAAGCRSSRRPPWAAPASRCAERHVDQCGGGTWRGRQARAAVIASRSGAGWRGLGLSDGPAGRSHQPRGSQQPAPRHATLKRAPRASRSPPLHTGFCFGWHGPYTVPAPSTSSCACASFFRHRPKVPSHCRLAPLSPLCPWRAPCRRPNPSALDSGAAGAW